MDVISTTGYSQVSDDSEIASAFGLKREASKPVPTPSTPPQVESSPPQEKVDGSISDTQKDSPKPDEVKPPEGQDKIFQKKASESHKLVIDLIEDKFTSGKMDDGELRKWFDEHPEFAEVANRSKRVKDRFRALMERDPASANDESLKARRDAQTRKDVDEIDDKPKENSLDGRSLNPITADDLQRILDERDERLIERQLREERRSEMANFAIEHQILDGDYQKFVSTAEAILKANPELDLVDGLAAAHRALWPSKGTQVSLPQGRIAKTPDEHEEKVDFSNPTSLFTKEEFFGKKN